MAAKSPVYKWYGILHSLLTWQNCILVHHRCGLRHNGEYLYQVYCNAIKVGVVKRVVKEMESFRQKSNLCLMQQLHNCQWFPSSEKVWLVAHLIRLCTVQPRCWVIIIVDYALIGPLASWRSPVNVCKSLVIGDCTGVHHLLSLQKYGFIQLLQPFWTAQPGVSSPDKSHSCRLMVNGHFGLAGRHWVVISRFPECTWSCLESLQNFTRCRFIFCSN